MKTIVIYCSKTGFTRRYADLLASALQCECAAFEERQDVDLNAYDCVIFGSWVCAGAIQQVKWFKKQIQALKGKRLIDGRRTQMAPASAVPHAERQEAAHAGGGGHASEAVEVLRCSGSEGD